MSSKTSKKFTRTSSSAKPFACIDFFHGLDATAPKEGEMRATAIENFRVHSNGTISKRPGFRPFFRINNPIRAYILTRIDGIPCMFLLAGSQVFHLSLKTRIFTACGSIASKTGYAHFFYHEGNLFLWATDSLYSVKIPSISPVVGYVPLIGKNWVNNYIGEPYEPMNFMTNQVRITYEIQDPPSIFLCSPYPIEAIHRVEVNGEVVPPERYELDTRFDTVNLFEPKAGDRVSVHISIKNGYAQEREAFLNSNRNVPFGKAEQGRLCCWSEHSPGFMFVSSHITKEQLEGAQVYAPESTSLYFPVGNHFKIGDGRYSIRGATRDRDRMLVFTEGNTWMVSESDSTTELFPTSGVNANIGTPSPGGVTLAGKNTVSIGNAAIYRWSDAQSGAYLSERISEKADFFLPYGFYKRAKVCYYSAEDEIWFLDPLLETVWILRLSTGDWYTFTGIPATELVDLGDRMGFITSDGLYAFDEDYTQDIWQNEDPVSFRAIYRADFGDMGTEAKKALSHLVLRGDSKDGALTIQIQEKNAAPFLCAQVKPDENGRYPEGRIRIPHRRLRGGSVTIQTEDAGSPTLSQFGVYTQ